jgi:hypothetical protein
MERQVEMTRRLLDMEKAIFEGMLNNMIAFWDQTEKLLGAFVDSATWVPPEGKEAFKEWMVGNRKGCETFKRAANEGFSWLEAVMNSRANPR